MFVEFCSNIEIFADYKKFTFIFEYLWQVCIVEEKFYI